MKKFVDKHMDKIIATRTCFDRIIFKGYLPISSASGIAAFFHNQQWLSKDFKKQASTPKASFMPGQSAHLL